MILSLLLCASALTQTPPVQTGLDQLVATNFETLAGKRFGIVCNQTSVDHSNRHVVELMLANKSCKLTAIFSPEHGFEGILDKEGIADGRHPSGIPIYSLYGEHKKPSPAQLRDLDLLVFDLQDVGCRFYTYLSTMLLCMEASYQQGIPFMVLDRPNPIGGDIDGPIADPQHESFVACHTLPVQHGMTLGELARLLQAERNLQGSLRVVKLAGWRRSWFFDRCGLPWINPSPNIRRPQQALLYPGIGLLEMTNISVGRGTDTPFEWIGAPWIDGLALARHLNGRALPGLRFVPKQIIPSASTHQGERCGGVDIQIVDRTQVEALHLGIELACALRNLYSETWKRTRLVKLLAHQGTLKALEAGWPPERVTNAWRADLTEFAKRRKPFLLY